MRKAAVTARLIPDNPSGHARLAFVSEGEASLYFSMENGVPSGALKNGDGVVIVDAGRETIDFSVYRRNTTEGGKETFDEMADAQCHFYGSEVVTFNARKFIGGESRKYSMWCSHLQTSYQISWRSRHSLMNSSILLNASMLPRDYASETRRNMSMSNSEKAQRQEEPTMRHTTSGMDN